MTDTERADNAELAVARLRVLLAQRYQEPLRCSECPRVFSVPELREEDPLAWGHPCPNGSACESHRIPAARDESESLTKRRLIRAPSSLTWMGVLCCLVGMSVMVSDIVGIFIHQPPVQPVGFGLLLATVGAIAMRLGRP